MNKFNFKSLAISGVAIASVLVLFRNVTAYGENHLRSTNLIHNRYHLTLTQKLPNCEKANTLILNIQQSGIYLNASLFPVNSNTDTKKQLTLTGILQNQQLELWGKIDSSIFCQTPSVQNSQLQPITIKMSHLNKNNISGQLQINNIFTTLKFTTLSQIAQKPIPKSERH